MLTITFWTATFNVRRKTINVLPILMEFVLFVRINISFIVRSVFPTLLAVWSIMERIVLSAKLIIFLKMESALIGKIKEWFCLEIMIIMTSISLRLMSGRANIILITCHLLLLLESFSSAHILMPAIRTALCRLLRELSEKAGNLKLLIIINSLVLLSQESR